MHGSFDPSGETTDEDVPRGWRIAVFAVPALLAAVLAGLAIVQPNVSTWVSEAAQAEFANSSRLAPAQVVRPAAEVHTVKAD